MQASPIAEPWFSSRWLRQQLQTAEDTGYFGPTSAMWRLHREAVIGLGLGRALLLQLAHPCVAQAVADHSTFHTQPVQRLISTVASAELLVFGSRRQADEAAARIRTIHRRIHGALDVDVGRWRRGDRYSAEDPEALLWVLATLIDTTLVMYESCFGGLDSNTINQYLRESARLGAMIGVPTEWVPRDRAALTQYMNEMMGTETVAVGPAARRIAHLLLRPDMPLRPRLITWPYRALTRAATVATMPEPIRSGYAPLLTPRFPSLYVFAGFLARQVVRRVPDRMRRDPLAATVIERGGLTAADTGD